MKVHIEVEMTPDEARKLMGLPDLNALQARMVEEMERRVKAGLDTSDPEAMIKAWMPLAVPGFEQFQRLLWESARMAATGEAKKPSAKASR